MRKSRFTDEQIDKILKLQENGLKVAGISASMASANRRITAGSQSMGAWRSRRLSA
jgi:hypothetical protein